MSRTLSTPMRVGGIAEKGVFEMESGLERAVWKEADERLKLALELKGS